MTEIDRPIKPDPKYIEEYLQKINQVQIKPYLKKKSNPTLPCYAHRQEQQHSSPQQHQRKQMKSKAELYQQIKRKNLQKFGERKQQPPIAQQKPTKLNPKKMTVSYKAKPVIQIEQYKKKDYIPHPKTAHTLPESKDKIEYEKLLDYFNKELKQLEHEKEEFNKVAEKLKFKEKIKNEEGLFYSQVKSQVQKQLTSTQPLKEDEGRNQQRTNHNSRENMNKLSKITEEKKLTLSKTYSAGQIRNKLEKTCEEMQLLKSQMLHQTLQIKQYRYQIFQAHLLPNFTPQAFYDYIDIAKLKYNGNSHYKAAMSAFNSKFQKENKDEGNAPEVDAPCRPGIKEKFIGEKRVSKYEGWTEVWIPGKQRLMANKEGYKVVWLANGDVLQQFSNDIKTYYSKAKQICKIELKDLPPIYYHEELKQIWRYLPDGSREIVFGNGRLDIVTDIPH